MAAAVGRGRRSRGKGLKRAVPLVYLALAMFAAVLVLPSALRPPPDPTTESGAISPDAPPDDNPDQLIQSSQQASGGGAGAAAGASTTTTVAGQPPPPAVTTTTLAKRAASGQCFGNPARQIESVYSGACAPGFVGDNGGATSLNVFPNEVRLGFWHSLGAPPAGRVADQPPPNEGGAHRTFRVLNAYVNKRFETYGRHIAFYGLAGGNNADDMHKNAEQAASEYKIFGGSHLYATFCEDIVRRGLVIQCNPQTHDVYTRNRPGFFSWMMDLTQIQGFGAEYVCKTLKGKPAKFAGDGVVGKPRKIGFLSSLHAQGGIPASVFQDAYRKECGGEVVAVQLSSDTDAAGTSAAMTKFQADGITTILLDVELGNTLLAMSAASGVYYPEWVLLANFGVDINVIGTLLPKDQAAHLFGLSGWELPRPGPETECARAYHSIDPDNDPDGTSCNNFWPAILNMMNGIQGAGPKLTPASFQKAQFALGYRYGQAPWSIGGGYGPDDYSYMDTLGEVWWSSTKQDPTTGAPGAYVWTHNGQRYKRGQFTGDDSQLFKDGIVTPPRGS